MVLLLRERPVSRGSGGAISVQFNTSNGTSWQWDFGDGSPVSTLYEPSYMYNTPGSYTVTLIAFDPGSCNLSDTITIPIVIGSGQVLDAVFTWTVGPDCTLPQIAFTNFSSGNPISYVWSMGADFDLPMIAHAFRSMSMEVPWKFWNSRCARTYKTLPQAAKVKLARAGTHHNALDDAVYQAQLMQAIQAELRGKVKA